MKAYHGTSFENACKILSEKEWIYPLEQFLIASYNVSLMTKKHRDLIKDIEEAKERRMLGLHFSTNISTAKLYAMQFDKPVILFVEFDGIEPCDDFIVAEPIPTDKVKALLHHDKEIKFYGGLVNALYGKGYGLIHKYFNNGLLWTKSEKEYLNLANRIIEDIQDMKEMRRYVKA